jgi:hypothetical protein
MSFTAEVEWLNKNHAVLVLDDVRVELYRSQDDLAPVVQISTDDDTDTHEEIRVHLNDSTAARWKP